MEAVSDAFVRFKVKAKDWTIVAERVRQGVESANTTERQVFVREAEIKRRLAQRDDFRPLAFAAGCCERLFPVYVSFSTDPLGQGGVSP